MISPEQWSVLEPFRSSIEEQYTQSVVGKPERLPAYTDTIGILKGSMERFALPLDDPDTIYPLIAGMTMTLSFVNNYFNAVCSDPHMLAHLQEAAVFLGYLARDLCFDVDAPGVTG